MNMIRREKLTAETRKLSGTSHSGFLYCGRPSLYGNPFAIDATHDRQQVIRSFKRYWQTIPPRERERFLNAARLAWKPGFGIVLLCWCKDSEPCHTDILVDYLISATHQKEGK